MACEEANSISREINLFLIAVGFFTRIPMPENIDFSESNLNRASRYFSLVGWLVGLIALSIYLLAELVFPSSIAILLSMGFSFLMTGGFHEDGLADTADGFGGGWDAEQKMEIMKDSRLGTYGSLALWFVLTLKFASLNELESILLAILVAHPLSRAMISVMMFISTYVTADKKSKAKPIAQGTYINDLYINLLVASPALIFILIGVGASTTLLLLLVLALLMIGMRSLFRAQIGGHTGDNLGATQQVTELSVYLCFLATQTL